MLEAIAIGTGSSFYNWIKTPVQEPKPTLHGCGVVPLYINGLTTYSYGDSDHLKHIPNPADQFHPGCEIYSTHQCTEHFKQLPFKVDPLDFCALYLPHGCSSGGMAITVACMRHNIVGLVGFDGDPHSFDHPTDKDLYINFVTSTSSLIGYWQGRGRRLFSLMPWSIFNRLLDRLPNMEYRN